MGAELFDGFAKLGPPLGSVVAIALISYFAITGILKVLSSVLSMFDKHGEALKVISDNMSAHTRVVSDMSENVRANTKATEQMIDAVKKKH